MWLNKKNKNSQCQCLIFSPSNKIPLQKSNKVTLKKKQIPKNMNQKNSIKQKVIHKLAISKPNNKHNQKPKEIIQNKINVKKQLAHPTLIQKQKTPPLSHNFKQLLKIPTFIKIPVKQTPAVIKKTILVSQYFSGLQVKDPEKKQQLIQFSYQNQKAQQQNMNRQASLNDFKQKTQETIKFRQQLMKRSQSDKQIVSKSKFKYQNIEQKSSNLKIENLKDEKSKSTKSATTFTLKNFQELRPKSIVSSGDNNSDQHSQYSEVIEHNLLNKNPGFYLDREK